MNDCYINHIIIRRWQALRTSLEGRISAIRFHTSSPQERQIGSKIAFFVAVARPFQYTTDLGEGNSQSCWHSVSLSPFSSSLRLCDSPSTRASVNWPLPYGGPVSSVLRSVTSRQCQCPPCCPSSPWTAAVSPAASWKVSPRAEEAASRRRPSSASPTLSSPFSALWTASSSQCRTWTPPCSSPRSCVIWRRQEEAHL